MNAAVLPQSLLTQDVRQQECCDLALKVFIHLGHKTRCLVNVRATKCCGLASMILDVECETPEMLQFCLEDLC